MTTYNRKPSHDVGCLLVACLLVQLTAASQVSRWFVILAYAKCVLYHALKIQQNHEYNTLVAFTSYFLLGVVVVLV
jgi:Ca2+/Na+ antiporter